MSGSQQRTRALLSIRPPFASAILNGKKRYEFRRSIFSLPVEVVVIYATVPVQRIVAEFDVVRVISGKPETLWKRTRQFAGIERRVFFEYFQGRQIGYAIEIGEVRRYERPYCPVEKLGIKPPQSFVYLDRSSEEEATVHWGSLSPKDALQRTRSSVTVSAGQGPRRVARR